MLERLLELHAGDGEKVDDLQRRLRDLDRTKAMQQGRRACLNIVCDQIEEEAITFLTCSRCKIGMYCSRECQIADWKMHSKLCKTVSLTSTADPTLAS